MIKQICVKYTKTVTYSFRLSYLGILHNALTQITRKSISQLTRCRLYLINLERTTIGLLSPIFFWHIRPKQAQREQRPSPLKQTKTHNHPAFEWFCKHFPLRLFQGQAISEFVLIFRLNFSLSQRVYARCARHVNTRRWLCMAISYGLINGNAMCIWWVVCRFYVFIYRIWQVHCFTQNIKRSSISKDEQSVRLLYDCHTEFESLLSRRRRGNIEWGFVHNGSIALAILDVSSNTSAKCVKRVFSYIWLCILSSIYTSQSFCLRVFREKILSSDMKPNFWMTCAALNVSWSDSWARKLLHSSN